MDGFDTYKTYLALKTHFNSQSYDYRKYNGKTGAKLESFIKRKDRFYFSRISNKYKDEVENYFIANFLEEPKGWVGNFNENNYKEWKKRNESLSYVIEQDIKSLCKHAGNFDDLFVSVDGQHPIIIKEYISKRVSHETMATLDLLLNYTRTLNEKVYDMIVYPKYENVIKKYQSLISINLVEQKIKILKIVKDYYES